MVLTAKILSLVIIFVVSIIFGIVPYFLLKWLSRKYLNSPKFTEVISIFNCFSGGVFFATSFLAILPEARMQMDMMLHRLSSDLNYPFTEAMLGVGFLGLLLIENIALSCYTSNADGMYEELNHETTKQTYGSTTDSGQDTEIQDGDVTKKEDDVNTDTGNGNTDKLSGQFETDNLRERPQHLHVHVDDFTNLRSVVLVIALSIHMIFDGLELGLLDTEDKVWSVLLALCIHKSLIFFSVGLTLTETLSNTTAIFLMIFIMALVSPIGGTIGIVVMSTTHGVVARVVSAFLQGAAVGTFIYVTFFEILLREFNKKTASGIWRSLAVIYGFGLFALLRYVVTE